jgi:hypothetical protein
MNAEGNVTFDGTLVRRAELLSAPASGAPCVHWRLKIIEPIATRMQFVHEISSPDAFDLAWTLPQVADTRASVHDARQLRLLAAEAPDSSVVRVRVMAESVRLTATPVLHRPGSPGALRVAQQLGLSSAIAVEEIVLAEGERVSAEGFLEGGALGRLRGPFRDVAGEVELHDADLMLPPRRELGPALLPWALGTAAAIFAGMGAVTWAAWHFGHRAHARTGAPPAQLLRATEIGPARYGRVHFSRPD